MRPLDFLLRKRQEAEANASKAAKPAPEAPAPGGRVADLWQSIVDYMNDHADLHPQLHFVSEAAPEDTTVQGSVFANGNYIDAFIKILKGKTIY